MNAVDLTGATPTLERYLTAVDDLAERAAGGDRVQAAITTAYELQGQIAALGADGGRLDTLTWAAWTSAAFSRILFVLGGAVDPADLERIGALPPAPPAPAPVPAAAVDPAQHALAV